MLATNLWVFLPFAFFSAYCVGLSKGGLPAVSMLSVPVLSFWINPLTAAALLLPIFIVSDMFGIWLYRRIYSARNLAILIPSGIFGVFLGYLAAPYLSVGLMNAAVGVIGLFYCLRSWFFAKGSGEPRPGKLGAGLFWGTLAGITSFVSHAGAPPFQIYVLPQKLAKLSFAGTATITFAMINFAKLPPYIALGQFEQVDFRLVGSLMVVAMVGTWSGAKLTKILPEKAFFMTVQLALFALSIQLIWRAFGSA